MFGCKVIDHENQPPIAKKQLLRLISIHAQVSVARLPALRCNRKCIQNDLDVHHNAWIEIISIPALQCIATHVQIILYALLVATQRRQSCYAHLCVYCELTFTCTLHVSTMYMYMYCTHQLYLIFMYVHVLVFLLKHLAIVIVIAVAQ